MEGGGPGVFIYQSDCLEVESGGYDPTCSFTLRAAGGTRAVIDLQ